MSDFDKLFTKKKKKKKNAQNVDSEKGHGAIEKRAWCGAIVKVANGNTTMFHRPNQENHLFRTTL